MTLATPYNSVIDLALVTIRDFKIDKLYALSPTDFDTYMEGFLIKAIPNFTSCTKDLYDTSEILREFNETLTNLEIKILAEYLIIEWLESEITDVKQITGMLQNKKEANRYSEANLLDKKILLKSTHKEDIDRLMVNYDFKSTDWEGWASGNYGI
jgi:hypothetical protein